MRHVLAISALTIVGVVSTAQGNGQRVATASTKPNFSGVWMGLPRPTPDPPPIPNELVASIDWDSPVTLTPDVLRVEVSLTLGERTSATKLVRFQRGR